MCMVVSTAIFGAVNYRSQHSPVGDAEAVACGGVCIAAASFTVGAVAVGAVNYFMDDGEVNRTALAETDANEARVNIYKSAVSAEESNDLLGTAYGNYLEDTASIATMEGKQAYIRALENDSSEGVAQAEAREAVSDYYAVKQIQLLKNWNRSVNKWQRLRSIAQNHPNVSSSYVNLEGNTGGDIWSFRYKGISDYQVTLVNNSDMTTPAIEYQQEYGYSPSSWGKDMAWAAPGPVMTSDDRRSYQTYLTALRVDVPNDNYDSSDWAKLLDAQQFRQRWSEIETQNQEVQNRIDNFTSSTYDQWSAGKISSEDLVDPYLGAREYAPEDGGYNQQYTMRSLQAMGIDMPENVANYRSMSVRLEDQGFSVDGILMSDGTPENGSFSVGETYNASNITGSQFVVSENRSTEIEGNFTITEVRDTEGNTVDTSSIEYKQVDYNTSDLSEYEQMLEELRATQEQLDAREQRLLEAANQSGGGGILSGLDGLTNGLPVGPTGAAAAGVGAVALLLLLRP